MKGRLIAALRPAVAHLFFCLLVVGALAALILFFWFPYPYNEISDVNWVILICAASLLCGPFLTLCLFNPVKKRWQWNIDIGIILVLQLATVVYCVYALALSRPIFLAYEGDRFRVVRAGKIIPAELPQASSEFGKWSWKGPSLIGVRLLSKTDPNYVSSLTRAMQGDHPAYRPERWVTYSSQKHQVLDALKPISDLKKSPLVLEALHRLLKFNNISENQIGYLPLVQDSVTDWIVLISREDGLPKEYLKVDGWGE